MGSFKVNDNTKKQESAKYWYSKQNFSSSYIKKFQRVVGTKDDGIVGKNTINSVITWQSKNKLDSDGKFGKASARKAGIEYESKRSSKHTESAKIKSASTKSSISGGINPKPGFQKQYNYKVLPYVSKTDYNKMKTAMGNTKYASWNIEKAPLSDIYKKAYKSNGGKTTIASSGCGVTSFANVKGISVTEAAEHSMRNGYRVYGSGTAAALFANNGGKSAGNAKNALNEVAKGKYLVASMGPGNWTRGGHFILVYGYSDDKVYVSDPASSKSTRAIGTKKQFTDSYKYGYLF